MKRTGYEMVHSTENIFSIPLDAAARGAAAADPFGNAARDAAAGFQRFLLLAQSTAFFCYMGSETFVWFVHRCMQQPEIFGAHTSLNVFTVLAWSLQRLPVESDNHGEPATARQKCCAHGGGATTGTQDGAASVSSLWQRVRATLLNCRRRHELGEKVAPP